MPADDGKRSPTSIHNLVPPKTQPSIRFTPIFIKTPIPKICFPAKFKTPRNDSGDYRIPLLWDCCISTNLSKSFQSLRQTDKKVTDRALQVRVDLEAANSKWGDVKTRTNDSRNTGLKHKSKANP